MTTFKEKIDDIFDKFSEINMQTDNLHKQYKAKLDTIPIFWWNNETKRLNLIIKYQNEYYQQINPLNKQKQELEDEWDNLIYQMVYDKFGEELIEEKA